MQEDELYEDYNVSKLINDDVEVSRAVRFAVKKKIATEREAQEYFLHDGDTIVMLFEQVTEKGFKINPKFRKR